MKRALAVAAIGITGMLSLTGCGPVGWEGKADVIELEYLDVEQEGGNLELEDLEVTVMDQRGREVSVVADEACAKKIRVGERFTYEGIIERCGTLGSSYDD